MTIEEALVEHNINYAPLRNLIGTRFEPVQRDQKGELPSISFNIAGYRATQHRDSARSNHGRRRFQFDVWGRTYNEAMNVTAVFKDSMAEFQRQNSPRVDVSLLQDERDAYEESPGLWRRIVDYHIWHTEV